MARPADEIRYWKRAALMGMTEIIAALPKLTHQQRRELCQYIIALEAEQEDLIRCDQSATEALSLLDRMEAEDRENT